MLVPVWKGIKLRSRKSMLPRLHSIEVAFDELTNRIAALDMQYVGSDPQTGGGFRNFFKRLVGCDAGGAALGAGGGFIGAIVGAILGSITGVSIYVHEQSVCMSIQNANQEIAAQLELYDAADTVGLIHNQIISEIFNEKGEAIYSLSQNDLKELILDKVEKHCGPSLFLLWKSCPNWMPMCRK